MRVNKITVSLFAAGLIASPLANATNGYFAHGYGMKAKGMAGAGIALPQDSIAAATNPAGMVLVGDRTDVGLDLFKPTRSANISGNMCGPGCSMDGHYDGNGKSLFFIPEIGYNKMLGSDMSLGVSVYGNGGMNTQYDVNPFASIGSSGPAGVNLEQLFIAPTWAKKLNSGHSIGVSLNLVYQTFSATGLQAFAGWSSNPAALTNTGKDSSTGVGLRLGWSGELTPSLTMGATYQPKTKMSKFSKYAGLFAEQGGFDIPATYGLGVAFKAMPATVIAVDYQAIQYSGVKSIANKLEACASPTCALGADNGLGFGWKDISVLKLGVSHALSDSLTLRGGVSHSTQPIPENQTFFNILAPGVVQDHLTLGATWSLSRENELTVGYMHALKKKVSGAGSIAPTGMPGEANIKMYEDSIGIAYSWKM